MLALQPPIPLGCALEWSLGVWGASSGLPWWRVVIAVRRRALQIVSIAHASVFSAGPVNGPAFLCVNVFASGVLWPRPCNRECNCVWGRLGLAAWKEVAWLSCGVCDTAVHLPCTAGATCRLHAHRATSNDSVLVWQGRGRLLC